MEIASEDYTSSCDPVSGLLFLGVQLVEPFNHLFCIVNCGVEEFAGVSPPPVEVDPKKTASVISVDHAIGVQHRDYFENELIAEGNCFWLLGE